MDFYFNLVSEMKQSGVNLEAFLAIMMKNTLNLQNKEKIDYRAYERDRIRAITGQKKEKKSKKYSKERGMVRFELNIGRVDRVGPADIVSSVANRCKIPGKNIGAIDILSDVSYFDIKEEYAKIAEKHLKQVKIRGKKVTAKQMK